MMKKHPLILCLALVTTLLGGCNEDDNDTFAGNDLPPFTNAAVINSFSPSYDDADIELVDIVDGVYTGNLTALPAEYGTGLSDYAVVTYGEHYYRIGRYDNDSISKYSIQNPGKRIYKYSTREVRGKSTNPQQIVFVSDTKAYLLQLETSKIWIVNPSATWPTKFKTGEIDLSHYDDGDGAVEMTDGVIVDGILYVTLQRTNFWSVIEGNAWVAVIDTNTDTEITVDGEADFPGIPLKTNSPMCIIYNNSNNALYVQSVGDYGYFTGIMVYNGGIEKINLNNYSSSIILDDGDSESHPYGLISDLVIFSDTLGYFVGYNSWGSNSLYQFNPDTGAVEAGYIAGLNGVDIPAINAGPDGSLWVSLADLVNPRVLVIDSLNNNTIDEVQTLYMPNGVAFANTAVDR